MKYKYTILLSIIFFLCLLLSFSDELCLSGNSCIHIKYYKYKDSCLVLTTSGYDLWFTQKGSYVIDKDTRGYICIGDDYRAGYDIDNQRYRCIQNIGELEREYIEKSRPVHLSIPWQKDVYDLRNYLIKKNIIQPRE